MLRLIAHIFYSYCLRIYDGPLKQSIWPKQITINGHCDGCVWSLWRYPGFRRDQYTIIKTNALSSFPLHPASRTVQIWEKLTSVCKYEHKQSSYPLSNPRALWTLLRWQRTTCQDLPLAGMSPKVLQIEYPYCYR